MKLVIDASLALAWVFEREKPEEAACAQDVLSMFDSAEIMVPALWHIEITNGLFVAERRKVITVAQCKDYLYRLSQLPIITENMTSLGQQREIIFALAREYGLTAYDSMYLDLVLRHNAKLATFDRQLAQAVRRAGGMLFNGMPGL